MKNKGCQTPKNWTPIGELPIMGSETLMSPKEHGTSHAPVQKNLRYGSGTPSTLPSAPPYFRYVRRF